jgi:NADP-dependent 3-hydroxy acid dehydrogenase YdfG
MRPGIRGLLSRLHCRRKSLRGDGAAGEAGYDWPQVQVFSQRFSMNHSDRIAVVTGAGSGIGAEVARQLAEAGFQVVAIGRREEKLRETASFDSQRIHVQPLDVGDRVAVDSMIQAVVNQHGRIDVLVNCAGTNTVDRASASVSLAEWERILHVNVTGAFNCIQAVIPQMRSQGAGTIVNISSVAGRRAIPLGGVAYNASKFAMTALGTTVGEEEKDHGIRVTNIYPGEVETPILDARPVPVSAEHRARILQPEDVAQAVILACSLPPRARIPELVIVPTSQTFV